MAVKVAESKSTRKDEEAADIDDLLLLLDAVQQAGDGQRGGQGEL